MNRRIIFLSILILFIGFGLWKLLHKKAESPVPSSAAVSQNQEPRKTEANNSQKPPLPAPKAPTVSNANAPGVPNDVMEYVRNKRADPQYDWKQPINFYGRVVDESNVPIADANIHFTWNDISEKGTSDADTKSDGNGFFSLIDRRGKAMSVTASKDGYYTYSSERLSSFEYANPADGLFTPNPNNPVVFHLRKKGVGESLIHGSKLFGSRIDGTLSYVDLVESKNSLTSPGDLTVRCVRSERNADKKFDWTFTLGAPDGGLVESTDEFMFLAPEEGYQPTYEISHKASDFDWVGQEKHKFYIKSQNGKHYARIEITIIPDYNKNAAYDLNWDLNPNASRNLESQ